MADSTNSDPSGGNKRHNDEPVESGNAKRSRGGSHNDDRVEVRMLIPVNTAGAIIGKGGSNIRDMRHEFNANIQIPDSQGIERVITATTSTIDDASKLVGRIVEALNDRLRHEISGSIRLLIHRSQAGTIIGLKGSRIKELRETTGATIKVNQECCPESTDRLCQIKGAVSVVVKCTAAILDLLQGAPPKGPVYNYDPNCWDDTYDYGGYNSFDKDAVMDSRGGRGRGGYGRGGRVGSMDRRGRSRYEEERVQSRTNYGGGYGGFEEDTYGDEEGYNDYGGQQDPYGEDAEDDGTRKTTQVTIPSSLAGSIIGKGGQRIRQIREDSGCMIKIDESVPGSDDRIITITGTACQTQNAQYLLQKSVRMYSGENFD